MAEAYGEAGVYVRRMADVVTAFFERFNAGDLDSVAEMYGPGYDYAEPMLGAVVDADQHLAAMRQYLEVIPDRRLDVLSRRPTPGGVAVECRYLGTRAADGITVDLPMTAVFDIDDDGGKVTRLRMYYELPSS